MATSRPFCYNPSPNPTIPGTDQVGDIAAGNGTPIINTSLEWWNGPDEDPGYVIAYIDPTGDHPNAPERILMTNYICHIGFVRTLNKTESEFIELAKAISGNNSLTTGSQSKAYLNSQGFWCSFNSNSVSYLNGMYVNGFSSILGNGGSQSALVNFISNKAMNDLTFYMGSLLNTSQNRTYMRSLVSQLHTAGQTRIFSNVTQAINCIDTNNPGTEASYNSGSSANEKFDGFTQEWEFWNSGNPYGDFSAFMADDIQIYNYCQANNMKYDIYLSKCEDYTTTYTDTQIADHIVTYHDTVHLVAYISESTYNSNKGLSPVRKAQLELLGNAAMNNGKVQKFTILWAANGNSGINMRTWFQSNPSLIAYTGFENEYNNWTSSAKSGLEFTGQKIYAYSGIYDL